MKHSKVKVKKANGVKSKQKSVRISKREALKLLRKGSLLDLGERADEIRKRLHPDGIVSFIVDRNMGPVQALKASAHATTSAKWHLFLFGILLGLINLAGALCFFIGLFATIPTSLVAYAHTYRQLSAEVSDDSPESEAMYVKLETD